jgi:hypothetical protein
LTGITSVLSKTKALFEIGEPGNPEVHHPIMAAGDPAQYGVEVVSIDLVKNEVKIKNGGAETNVTFEAATLSAPPAPPPQMAGRGIMGKTADGKPIVYPGAGAPPGSAAQPGASTVVGNTRRGGNNSRGGVVVGGGAAADPMSNYTQGGNNNALNANRTIPPPRPLRTPTQPNAAPMSREEAIIRLELQREINNASNIPMPPLPPTPITPQPTGRETDPQE